MVAFIIVIVVVIALLLTPAVQNLIAETLLSPFQEKVPESAVFEMERTLTVSANGGILRNFTLDTPALRDFSPGGIELQQVLNFSYSPPASATASRYGVPWLVWNNDGISGSSVYEVSLTCEVRVDAHVWDIDNAASGNISDIPLLLRNEYLRDEWKIIIDDPGIEDLSRSLVGSQTNVRAVLFSIYDWVTKNVRYPSSPSGGDPASSVETLASKVGDCDDQSILFCALARAAGIPAWLQLGSLYDTSTGKWNGHGWVQTYIPLKAGGGQAVIIDTVNRDFLVYKPNRVIEYTDDGDGAHLRDYYYSFTYTYVTESYPAGQGPIYQESYTSISYEPSAAKISTGSIFSSMQPGPAAIGRLASLKAT